MKRRHVRAIAVFGIVLITLTGARGSRGGGCDNDHSSGTSSSSGSGGSHYDDYDGGTDGGSVSGGEDATESPTDGSAAGPVDATAHVEFKYCSIDPAAAHLRGHLYITNSAATDQTYDITVQFEGDSPSAAPVTKTISDVTVAALNNYEMDVEAPYTGPGKETDTRNCKVASATRTASVS
ncbi:hypothetical protein [Streptomyces sp. NPDC051219]|uniref:hypothetical protein n=1 Tax=Streptomyces sp. NPDC051219 TaxID=3155283 RepID=UPI00342AD41F